MAAFSFTDLLLSNKIHLNDLCFASSQAMLSGVRIAQTAAGGKM